MIISHNNSFAIHAARGSGGILQDDQTCVISDVLFGNLLDGFGVRDFKTLSIPVSPNLHLLLEDDLLSQFDEFCQLMEGEWESQRDINEKLQPILMPIGKRTIGVALRKRRQPTLAHFITVDEEYRDLILELFNFTLQRVWPEMM